MRVEGWKGELQAASGAPREDEWWVRVWHAGATSVLVVSESDAWRTEVAQLLEYLKLL